jgi:hypothetical protein
MSRIGTLLTVTVLTLAAAGVLSLWVATASYSAGVQAGEWKGRAETMERIMGAAAYNLATLNGPSKTK